MVHHECFVAIEWETPCTLPVGVFLEALCNQLGVVTSGIHPRVRGCTSLCPGQHTVPRTKLAAAFWNRFVVKVDLPEWKRLVPQKSSPNTSQGRLC